mmetsp:Transcript_73711/g.210096  ORF Transcript_73711/g.210096 Transcript_73711/m.210096 type:complete len:228 (-) Transcript_73711:492-1175(-)
MSAKSPSVKLLWLMLVCVSVLFFSSASARLVAHTRSWSRDEPRAFHDKSRLLSWHSGERRLSDSATPPRWPILFQDTSRCLRVLLVSRCRASAVAPASEISLCDRFKLVRQPGRIPSNEYARACAVGSWMPVSSRLRLEILQSQLERRAPISDTLPRPSLLHDRLSSSRVLKCFELASSESSTLSPVSVARFADMLSEFNSIRPTESANASITWLPRPYPSMSSTPS